MAEKPPPQRYVTSPVDYEAWRKGYMPPSEHVLIHELSFGGAKIKASSSCLTDSSWWLVIKGDFDLEDYADITEVITRCLAVERRKKERASLQSIEEPRSGDEVSQPGDGQHDTNNREAE